MLNRIPQQIEFEHLTFSQTNAFEQLNEHEQEAFLNRAQQIVENDKEILQKVIQFANDKNVQSIATNISIISIEKRIIFKCTIEAIRENQPNKKFMKEFNISISDHF